MKLWIVYYSLSGNTKRIAEQIRETLGGDLSEIETIVPYTGDYNAVVAQGEEEIRRGFMPEIRPCAAYCRRIERSGPFLQSRPDRLFLCP